MTTTPEERAAAITEVLEEAFRAADRAAYERGVEHAAQIVDGEGKFWRRSGLDTIANKIRELMRTSTC